MLLNTMSGTYRVLHVNAHQLHLETQNSIIYCSRHRVLWNEFCLLFMLDLPNSDTLQKKGDREGLVYMSLPNRELLPFFATMLSTLSGISTYPVWKLHSMLGNEKGKKKVHRCPWPSLSQTCLWQQPRATTRVSVIMGLESAAVPFLCCGQQV